MLQAERCGCQGVMFNIIATDSSVLTTLLLRANVCAEPERRQLAESLRPA